MREVSIGIFGDGVVHGVTLYVLFTHYSRQERTIYMHMYDMYGV